MASRSERYNDPFHCPVIRRDVSIRGEKVFPQGGGPGSVAVSMARTMDDCSGMTICRLFHKRVVIRPTGCPYFDANCSGSELPRRL
jgi:hypothetical protein